MAETNFPSNTSSDKNEPKKLDRVTTSEPIKRKKPIGKRLAETFVKDEVDNVGQYILFDVVVPAVKEMVSSAVSQGIERMLFGDSRPNRSRTNNSTYRPSYSSYSRSPGGRAFEADDRRREVSKRARATHDFDEIILADRGEAEMVLDSMGNTLDSFDVVTVADLYDLVGTTPEFTDNTWGWRDLRGAEIRRVREGYLLNLPKPQPID